MVSGSISSFLASMQGTSNLQSMSGVRGMQQGKDPGPEGLTSKLESQLESEGIETLDSGKSISEFIGELKTAIEDTIEELGEDADPQAVHEAVKETVESMMEENGLNPEDYLPPPPPDGMSMPPMDQNISSDMMSQIGEQLSSLLSGQSTSASSDLLAMISQIPVGAGLDVSA